MRGWMERAVITMAIAVFVPPKAGRAYQIVYGDESRYKTCAYFGTAQGFFSYETSMW